MIYGYIHMCIYIYIYIYAHIAAASVMVSRVTGMVGRSSSRRRENMVGVNMVLAEFVNSNVDYINPVV